MNVPDDSSFVSGGRADTAEHAAILQLQADWIAAQCAGRVDDLLDLCTSNITIYPPIGAPIQGLPAVRRAMLETAAPVKRIHLSDVSITITEGMAVKRARFIMALPGRAAPLTGWHVWILLPRWYVDTIAWTLDQLPE